MQRKQLKVVAVAVAAGAAVALSGVAHAAPAADPAQTQREQITKGAVGHQDGQVQKVQGNNLQLQPYQKKAGVANLTATADTKVFAFEPNGLVSSGMSSAVLNPGANVRVYFKPSPDGKTQQIVAIQLLPMSKAVQEQAGQANK